MRTPDRNRPNLPDRRARSHARSGPDSRSVTRLARSVGRRKLLLLAIERLAWVERERETSGCQCPAPMSHGGRDRPPRVRPGFRRFAIGAFIVLMPIALHTAWDHHEARRLAQLVTDIRSRNEPITSPLAGIGPRLESSQSAARYYEAAAALVEPGADSTVRRACYTAWNMPPVPDRPRLLGELRTWRWSVIARPRRSWRARPN